MTVAISIGCYYIVNYFRAINKKRDDESIAKKKVADRRVAEAAHAGQVSEAGFHDEASENLSLLDRRH